MVQVNGFLSKSISSSYHSFAKQMRPLQAIYQNQYKLLKQLFFFF